MPPSKAPEAIVDLLTNILPAFMPVPTQVLGKAAITPLGDQIKTWLGQARTSQALLNAARKAEEIFVAQSPEELGDDELAQAIASFPLYNEELFQRSLENLLEHLDEELPIEYLESGLLRDWPDKFSDEQLIKGLALYLKYLRLQLLKVDGFSDIVAKLATLRIDERTESIQQQIDLLLELVRELIQRDSPSQTTFSPLFSLPTPPADFTGRDEELIAIKAELSRDGTAAISGLSGMGGVGKTVLGLKAAHDLRKDFPDAQIYIEMKGTTEPIASEDAMREIILAFEPTADLREASPTQLAGLYRSLLQDKKALLFFDNALNAVQIKPLIEGIPCAALVTSRRHFPLAGLRPTRLDVMSPEDAKNLLLELAPRIGESAVQLAKLCGYLPLALRIAGNFLALNENWTVAEYIEKLSDERNRLSELKSPDDPDLDVEAASQLSYEQLDEETQTHWRKLAVFPAPFDHQAAAAVLAREENETRTLLGLLRRFSFILFEEERGKYHLHDLLRDFALKELSEEENFSACLNHASYYKEIASYADELYIQGGEKVLQGLALFDASWSQIQAGQAWAAEQQRIKGVQELAMLYPEAAACCLRLRIQPQQEITWLITALNVAQDLGNKHFQEVHLGNLGIVYNALGDYQKAIQLHKDALMIAHEIGNRWGEGSAHNSIGSAYKNLGDAKKAIQHHDESLKIRREIGDRREEGGSFGGLGSAYFLLGNFKKAIQLYEEELVIAREVGNRRGEGEALGGLAVGNGALGATQKSIKFSEKALDIAREIGDRRGEGLILNNLGATHHSLGNLKTATQFYEKSLNIVRDSSDIHGEGDTLTNLSLIYKNLGEYSKAKSLLQEALAIYQAIKSSRAKDVQHWLDDLEKDT